jgi:hypothetical protein
MKYKYVVLSKILDENKSFVSYEVSITYASNFRISYTGKVLKGYKDFIYKNEQIIDILFDEELIVDTIDGKIILKEITAVEIL